MTRPGGNGYREMQDVSRQLACNPPTPRGITLEQPGTEVDLIADPRRACGRGVELLRIMREGGEARWDRVRTWLETHGHEAITSHGLIPNDPLTRLERVTVIEELMFEDLEPMELAALLEVAPSRITSDRDDIAARWGSELLSPEHRGLLALVGRFVRTMWEIVDKCRAREQYARAGALLVAMMRTLLISRVITPERLAEQMMLEAGATGEGEGLREILDDVIAELARGEGVSRVELLESLVTELARENREDNRPFPGIE